jgi:hypothetical protein
MQEFLLNFFYYFISKTNGYGLMEMPIEYLENNAKFEGAIST